jgi:lysophospholipase L1-like esterase
VNKIYVDGCSFTYAQGLDRVYSVGAQLTAAIDKSRPGKSNTAIVTELYNDIDKYDTFVLGLTFPSRYTFYNDDTPVEIQPGKQQLDTLVDHPMGEFIENTYPQFCKVLWSLTSEQNMNILSNFYLNSIVSLLKEKNKKYVIYSMTSLQCNDTNYFHLTIPSTPQYRISSEDIHFNITGMQLLVSQIRERL